MVHYMVHYMVRDMVHYMVHHTVHCTVHCTVPYTGRRSHHHERRQQYEGDEVQGDDRTAHVLNCADVGVVAHLVHPRRHLGGLVAVVGAAVHVDVHHVRPVLHRTHSEEGHVRLDEPALHMYFIVHHIVHYSALQCSYGKGSRTTG